MARISQASIVSCFLDPLAFIQSSRLNDPRGQLLTGPLEPTNEWYAIAKIAGLKLCQAYRKQYGRRYISVMPCNLYGPNDNFDLKTSHVLPALIRKFHEAKVSGASEVVIWAVVHLCVNFYTLMISLVG